MLLTELKWQTELLWFGNTFSMKAEVWKECIQLLHYYTISSLKKKKTCVATIKKNLPKYFSLFMES